MSRDLPEAFLITEINFLSRRKCFCFGPKDQNKRKRPEWGAFLRRRKYWVDLQNLKLIRRGATISFLGLTFRYPNGD